MWEAKEVWGFGSWYQESIRFGSAIACVWPKLNMKSSLSMKLSKRVLQTFAEHSKKQGMLLFGN